jgi:transposase-like protein
MLEIGGMEAVISQDNKYYQPAEKVRAAMDVLDGRSVADVAAELGASDYTVRRWVDRYRKGGIEAMKDRRVLRRGCRMVSAQEYDMLTKAQSVEPTHGSSANDSHTREAMQRNASE